MSIITLESFSWLPFALNFHELIIDKVVSQHLKSFFSQSFKTLLISDKIFMISSLRFKTWVIYYSSHDGRLAYFRPECAFFLYFLFFIVRKLPLFLFLYPSFLGSLQSLIYRFIAIGRLPWFVSWWRFGFKLVQRIDL